MAISYGSHALWIRKVWHSALQTACIIIYGKCEKGLVMLALLCYNEKNSKRVIL